jgi:hypothetical protein
LDSFVKMGAAVSTSAVEEVGVEAGGDTQLQEQEIKKPEPEPRHDQIPIPEDETRDDPITLKLTKGDQVWH